MSLDDLAGHDCLAMPPVSGRTIWRLDGPERPVEVQVSGRFCANAAHVLLKASLAGLGIVLLPEMMTSPHVRSGHLIEVLPTYCVEGLDIYLVYLSRRQLPRAVTVFIEFAMTKIVAAGLVRPGDGEQPRFLRTA